MQKTALHDIHVSLNAKMVEFAGYSMPVTYGSIIEEHNWTRSHIGLFDVSHMGRIAITGQNAGSLLDKLATRKVSNIDPGRTAYALMCNPNGGALDDLMISKIADNDFYVVCNAGNHEKILNHLQANAPQTDVTINDLTNQTVMIAIQGPQVSQTISKLLPGKLAELPHRRVLKTDIFGINFIAFRGGYTGEDGYEVVFDAAIGPTIWNQLSTLANGGDPIVKPVGLGARDTLRLEAALPLYGHELSETIDPISAGLEFAVKFDHDFIGKDALEKIANDGPQKVRVGIKLDGKRAARQGYRVLANNTQIGEVTSGAFCPTVQASIALALVNPNSAEIGTSVQIDTGRSTEPAKIVPLPFYKRK